MAFRTVVDTAYDGLDVGLFGGWMEAVIPKG